MGGLRRPTRGPWAGSDDELTQQQQQQENEERISPITRFERQQSVPVAQRRQHSTHKSQTMTRQVLVAAPSRFKSEPSLLPAPAATLRGPHAALTTTKTTTTVTQMRTLLLALVGLLLLHTGPRVHCQAASSSWTAERNTSSAGELGDLVAIGAISLLEPTTTATAGHRQQQQQPQDGAGQPTLKPAAINKLDYIVEFMRSNKLGKFCDLLTSEEPEVRELNERLNQLERFTLFVPTNEALLLMPAGQLQLIRSSGRETKQFLLAHATNELVTPKTLQQQQQQVHNSAASGADSFMQSPATSLMFSLAGSPLHITSGSDSPQAKLLRTDGSPELIINGASVISGQSYALQEQLNTSATYAIVHLVDRALYPGPSLRQRELLRMVAPRWARYLELAADSGLEMELNSLSGLTTVFAPNDEAFKVVPQKVLDQLDTNRTFLANFLRGHVIEGLRYGALLTIPGAENATIESLAGSELQFELKRLQSRNLILVNSIPIIEQDLVALNGLVHLIARPIFEGHLSESCRCGLQQSTASEAAPRGQTSNLSGGGALANEKLWTIDKPPARPNSGSILDENPGTGNELEREESNQSAQMVAQTPPSAGSRIRAQRSGLVARNNRDFYRPSAAPANLLLVTAAETIGGAQPANTMVPPVGVHRPTHTEHSRASDRLQAAAAAAAEVASGGGGDRKLASSGDLFDVERYKVVLNADTRQRMREQHASSNSAASRFTYDRPLASATGPPSEATTRAYSPVETSNLTGQLPSSNVSAWSNTEQLALSSSNSRAQRLLKFQPEDARPSGGQPLQNSTMRASAAQVAYTVLAPFGGDQQAAGSSRQQQQQAGKTVAPPSGGCAFYDTECKRLFGRLVRLPAIKGPERIQQQHKTISQFQQDHLNNATHQPPAQISTTEQHLDSTFGETTETPLGNGWTQSMPLQPSQQLQKQPPAKAFHRLSPARVSPLNQPLPPWSEDERGHLSVGPNWRGPDKDIARITQGGQQQPTQQQQHGQLMGGFGFTNGISRDPAVKLGNHLTGGARPAADQIYHLTPVSVIQADAFSKHQNLSSRPADPHELLRDGNKAIFVSPSPILRLSQPPSGKLTLPGAVLGNQAPRQQQQQQLTTLSFTNHQYHTPTPYSVSLVTTHLPPIFGPAAAGAPAQHHHQYSRLTNFTTVEHALDDTPQPQPPPNSNNNKRIPYQFELTPSIPKAPSAHRKQRLQQIQMENNGSFGANFELNPANGEKQSRRIVRVQSLEPPIRQQTIVANGEAEASSSLGDISVTSARLTGSPAATNYSLLGGSLATQASNQTPNVSNSLNSIRSVPSILAPTASDHQHTVTDFFQDRTIAEIMDDSGLRIDGQQVTFSRLKECLTEADLLSLVTQTGSSLTIFMPTDSAFQRLVQQQAILQQRLPSTSAGSSSSSSSARLSGRLSQLEPGAGRRSHLLPLVVRHRARGSRQVAADNAPADDLATIGNELAAANPTLAAAAERLTLDCSSGQVRQLLLDHLSARLLTPKQLQSDLAIASLGGHQLLLSSVPTKKIVVVDGQPVIAATRAKNGMVYVINKFLNLTQQAPNVVELMESQANLSTFLSYLRFSSLSDRLRRETGPLTVLAPTNEAFEQLSAAARQLINSDPAALMDILRAHILEGAQYGKLVSMRSQLRTMNPDQLIEARVLRPNVYTLDGQPTSMRLVGTTGNGVLNTIDRLIVPAWLRVTMGTTTTTTTTNRPPPSQANGAAGLRTTNPRVGDRLTFGGGGGELESLGPATPGSAPVNFLPAISGQPVRFEQPAQANRLANLAGSNTFLFADANANSSTSFPPTSLNPLADGSTPVNTSPFLRVADSLSGSLSPPPRRSTLTTPDLLSPLGNTTTTNAQSTSKNMQLIEKLANLMQARKFVKYLTRSRVSELLKPDMNYVILVPTDQAIEKLPKQITEMLERDLERLADLMNYHVLDTTFEYINAIPDGQTLNTLNEKDIVFNWHRNNTILTASGAVVMGGIQEDNIALLIVDRVLYPTPGDILNIVAKSPILAKFTGLIRQAGLERQLSLPGPYTLFAPSDFAFGQMEPRELDSLQRNKEAARRFLLRHLSQPTVFTSSIALANGTQLTVTNSLGEDLRLRQRNDYFSVNEVNFSYADVAATNGVVHVIDGLL